MEEEEDFGIDNVKIENFMNKSGDNVSKNILRMFPADEKNRLNNINIKIKNKGAKYPFMIANTDTDDKSGWHWWSFLDIVGENSLFFFSTLLELWVS